VRNYWKMRIKAGNEKLVLKGRIEKSRLSDSGENGDEKRNGNLNRWKPTELQRSMLMEEFDKEPYPSVEYKGELASRIGVKRQQIAKWFQHRRESLSKAGKFEGQKQRDRRTPQELHVLQDAFNISPYPSADEIQNIVLKLPSLSEAQVRLWFKHKRNSVIKKGPESSSNTGAEAGSFSGKTDFGVSESDIKNDMEKKNEMLSELSVEQISGLESAFLVSPNLVQNSVGMQRLADHLKLDHKQVLDWMTNQTLLQYPVNSSSDEFQIPEFQIPEFQNPVQQQQMFNVPAVPHHHSHHHRQSHHHGQNTASTTSHGRPPRRADSGIISSHEHDNGSPKVTNNGSALRDPLRATSPVTPAIIQQQLEQYIQAKALGSMKNNQQQQQHHHHRPNNRPVHNLRYGIGPVSNHCMAGMQFVGGNVGKVQPSCTKSQGNSGHNVNGQYQNSVSHNGASSRGCLQHLKSGTESPLMMIAQESQMIDASSSDLLESGGIFLGQNGSMNNASVGVSASNGNPPMNTMNSDPRAYFGFNENGIQTPLNFGGWNLSP